MTTCSVCGKVISRNATALKFPGHSGLFHSKCMSEDMLEVAVTEWDAIASRGIRYFVDKYVPAERKAEVLPQKRKKGGDNADLAYLRLFLLTGKSLKVEQGRRQHRAGR